MRAAVLEELNFPLAVREVELPELVCGQVLVEVYCAGVCGAQLRETHGLKGPDPFLPHLLGHEGAGIVRAVGPGVAHVKENDHVVMHWRKGLGIDAPPPRYKYGNKTIGAGPVATFSEYAVVSENRVTAIDKKIPFDVAALMGCAVTTAFGCINNEAVLKIGQSIVVAGCGGVGLLLVQAAAMVSGNPIIAVDLFPEKLKVAEELGATHTFCFGEEDLETAVSSITDRIGVDVFVDCTGMVDIIDQGLRCTACGGKLILLGQPKYDKDLVLRKVAQHYFGKTILDSQGGLTNPTVDIPRYLGLYTAGRLKLDQLIVSRFPLDQVNVAFNLLRSGRVAGRCFLEMKKE